jgi:LemA protein
MFNSSIAMPIFLIVIVVVIGAFFVSVYNGLVVKRNRVKNAWAQIDVMLKKRFDLIPNIVETVKGYAAHEKSTFEEIARARSAFQGAGTPEGEIAANNMMTAALGKLFAVAENYPDLKASTNFMGLQAELSDVEQKIAFSRQFYNDTTLMYNNAIEVFPNNLVAGMFGFVGEVYFQIEEESKATPQVKF